MQSGGSFWYAPYPVGDCEEKLCVVGGKGGGEGRRREREFGIVGGLVLVMKREEVK